MTAKVGRDGKFRPEVLEGGAAAPSVETAPFERGDEVELARRLVRRLRGGSESLLCAHGTFYRYSSESGAYEAVDGNDVVVALLSFAGSPLVNSRRTVRVNWSNVGGSIRLARAQVVSDTGVRDFKGARRGVACRNGFVVVEGGEVKLLPKSRDHLARFAMPFDYDPSAPTTRLRKFFDGVFADASSGDELRRVAMLQEFLGACLVGDVTSYQQCLVLWGREGGNGKSQFLTICKSLFHPDAVCSVPPQRWGERFTAARLVGKQANFVDEIPDSDITSSDVFKVFVDGGYVLVEDKHKDPVHADLEAGHVFNVNRMPRTSDVTPAFYRRFLVCPFECDMQSSVDFQTNVGASIAAEERQGILAWAVEGAARRQRQKAYTESTRGKHVFRTWRSYSDPLMAHVLAIASGEQWKLSELHRSCVEAGLTTATLQGFGRFMSGMADPEDESRPFDKHISDGIWYSRRK